MHNPTIITPYALLVTLAGASLCACTESNTPVANDNAGVTSIAEQSILLFDDSSFLLTTTENDLHRVSASNGIIDLVGTFGDLKIRI